MAYELKPSLSICSSLCSVTLLSNAVQAEPLSEPDLQANSSLKVMLANDYQDGMSLKHYWYSEKLDGIRAIWTGEQLISRNGHLIQAPKWFTEALPKQALDGELWAGRGQFHKVQQTVLDAVPRSEDWKLIRFMVFDKPQSTLTFEQRYQQLTTLLQSLNSSFVQLVTQQPLNNETDLYRLLTQVEQQQGEGIMLKNKLSRYQAGRSDDLIKVKSYQDAEAVVIGYKPGNGKYQGKVGSLLVKWQDEQVFYIGSGLSDEDRNNPPPLGAIITFRYNGLTYQGVPRFARFSHERKE